MISALGSASPAGQPPYADLSASLHDLIFADDCTLNAAAEEDMRRNTDPLTAAYVNYGLTINTSKGVNKLMLLVRDGENPDALDKSTLDVFDKTKDKFLRMPVVKAEPEASTKEPGVRFKRGKNKMLLNATRSVRNHVNQADR
ncbi:unnamed protein product [Schistocephalus solidus]|uniref:Reverse transcriptase domain-containing protein n=1 Tax=Schistocephalus solidus TaxID=70667 RepID=A0A183T4E7_SCHSO|nr:unnamed protein product [Schistocephalus solidus]